MKRPTPELVLTPQDAAALTEVIRFSGGLEPLEQHLLTATSRTRIYNCLGPVLLERARELWNREDHFVVRGLPEHENGSAALVLAAFLFDRFKTYRGDKIVK